MPASSPPPHRRWDPTRPATTVLVLAGGDPPHPALVVPPVDAVVAADSGAEQAAALGVEVDVLVGDLDSVSPATVAAVRTAGAVIDEHHPDKDATDLELALIRALALGASRVVVVGGGGGRLDHAWATRDLLAAVAAPGRRVEAWVGPALVQVTCDVVVVDGRVGEQVSLLACDGAVTGVTTAGLRWALDGAALAPGSTRGVSNELSDPPARIRVETGTLAVVRPHALDPAADARPPVPDRPAADRPATGGDR